ncbi:WYL domain-containing protein [Pedobacter borealis]|uniref:WYL domain-containing protein n=1 Tax=Pedobacter borealis TaxID=475254 RepID=UPI0009F8ECB9|nr:WYL domain-containing protein [Pedobacter borealis]
MILEFTNDHASYVVTKPMHQSQVVLSKNEKTTTFRIDVVLNYELEREILGFGECVKVLSPRLLISKIKRRLEQTFSQYETKEEMDIK